MAHWADIENGEEPRDGLLCLIAVPRLSDSGFAGYRFVEATAHYRTLGEYTSPVIFIEPEDENGIEHEYTAYDDDIRFWVGYPYPPKDS